MEYDDRTPTEQWLSPRPRGRKTLAQIDAEESRRRAIARGGRVPAWEGFFRPLLLWVAGVVGFLLAMGLLTGVLSGHS